MSIANWNHVEQLDDGSGSDICVLAQALLSLRPRPTLGEPPEFGPENLRKMWHESGGDFEEFSRIVIRRAWSRAAERESFDVVRWYREWMGVGPLVALSPNDYRPAAEALKAAGVQIKE